MEAICIGTSFLSRAPIQHITFTTPNPTKPKKTQLTLLIRTILHTKPRLRLPPRAIRRLLTRIELVGTRARAGGLEVGHVLAVHAEGLLGVA